MIDMLRVHAYIRYSSVMQDDGFSVEYQLNEINEYCKRNGWTLHKTHIDQDHTATQVAGRDSFFDLLNEIQNGDDEKRRVLFPSFSFAVKSSAASS